MALVHIPQNPLLSAPSVGLPALLALLHAQVTSFHLLGCPSLSTGDPWNMHINVIREYTMLPWQPCKIYYVTKARQDITESKKLYTTQGH